jgi:hypothetical protein
MALLNWLKIFFQFLKMKKIIRNTPIRMAKRARSNEIEPEKEKRELNSMIMGWQ